MPREITRDQFEKLLPEATAIKVIREGDSAKVKLRTPSLLYTLKTTSEEADALIKGSKLPIEEY
jgi:hypothetical protein